MAASSKNSMPAVWSTSATRRCPPGQAAAAHSLGEIVSEAGGWELAFEWADPVNSGAYQGLSQAGVAIGRAVAPVVITSTAIGFGLPGWLLLGGVFLAAGAGTRALSGSTTVRAQPRRRQTSPLG
jgi:hypothetical protein